MANILIVDDSRFQRNRICKMVSELGHEVAEADNGVVGLKKVKTSQPDCIITDLLMPEMDGFDFLKRLASSGDSIPVIVLSADIQESSKSKCLEYGACTFLNKPPKEAELALALEQVLAPPDEEVC